MVIERLTTSSAPASFKIQAPTVGIHPITEQLTSYHRKQLRTAWHKQFFFFFCELASARPWCCRECEESAR
jgi:hypothetical protein